jgi:hypothetical protein
MLAAQYIKAYMRVQLLSDITRTTTRIFNKKSCRKAAEYYATINYFNWCLSIKNSFEKTAHG